MALLLDHVADTHTTMQWAMQAIGTTVAMYGKKHPMALCLDHVAACQRHDRLHAYAHFTLRLPTWTPSNVRARSGWVAEWVGGWRTLKSNRNTTCCPLAPHGPPIQPIQRCAPIRRQPVPSRHHTTPHHTTHLVSSKSHDAPLAL